MVDAKYKHELLLFCKKIGYEFKDFSVVMEAFTHKTFDHATNYQRLEFLGDSVLNFVIAKNLFAKYPTLNEGILTKLRMQVIRGENLVRVSDGLAIVKLVRLKDSFIINDKLKEDILESLIGAIFVDGGIRKVEKFIKQNFELPKFDNLTDYYGEKLNYKGALQELMQKNSYALPIYKEKFQDGSYEVSCELGLLGLELTVQSSNKKQAEQQVAKGLLSKILTRAENLAIFIPKSVKNLDF